MARDTVDVLSSYDVSSTVDNQQRREALAELEKAGVTCVLVTSQTRSRAATMAFLQAFREAYP